MKYIIIIISLLTAGLFTNNLNAQSNERDLIEVKVDGLGCPFCAYGLEKKFKEFKGLKNPKIDMETGIFTFSYPTDKEISIEQITKKVDAAGYTAVTTKIERATGEIVTSETTKNELSEEGALMEETAFVAGNCGMCKARIEKTASEMPGVLESVWDIETNQLTVKYDNAQTDFETILNTIAKSGHDSEVAKTTEEVYEALPVCCQYDRD